MPDGGSSKNRLWFSGGNATKNHPVKNRDYSRPVWRSDMPIIGRVQVKAVNGLEDPWFHVGDFSRGCFQVHGGGFSLSEHEGGVMGPHDRREEVLTPDQQTVQDRLTSPINTMSGRHDKGVPAPHQTTIPIR